MAEAPHMDDPANLLRLAECDVGQEGEAEQSPYDALAELFLQSDPATTPLRLAGEDEPAAAPATPPPLQTAAQGASQTAARAAPAKTGAAAAVEFELVVVGRLPGVRRPWVAQHVVQTTTSPVAALLSLEPDRTRLELFAPEGGPAPGAAASLEEALQWAAALAPTWFVAAAPDQAAAALQGREPSTVTLLSGADDEALALAHQALRTLHEAGCEAARLRIVGAAPDVAQAAGASLRGAAASLLGMTVEVLAPAQRIEPAGGVALLDEEGPLEAGSALKVLQRAIEASTTATAPAEAASEPPTPPDRLRAEQELRDMRIEPLSSLLSPPLEALPVRCPREPAVELALDDASALHLLVRRSPRVFEAAALVRAWAQEHSELLELAVRRPVRRAGEAPLHIFVESAEEARRLLQAPCRVHLLVLRTIAGQDQLFAVDL